jgi:predicted lipoprotein with Yx(FWY)xxD motif
MRCLKLAEAAVIGTVTVFALSWAGSPARATAAGGTPTPGHASPAPAPAPGGTSAAAHASAAPSPGGMVMARKIGKVTVLTNDKGFTLYSFGPDTPTKSACNGACVHYWPPLKGPVTAGPGVTGKLGTIKRSDGSMQATYNGHPLYTFIGDTKPGQDKGNNLILSGGIWHVVPASGMTARAPSMSHSPSGGGY